MNQVASLDATNLRLLAELSTDPRMSMSELARRVGMSSPAVTERVQRLEQSGVIAGYRLDVDPKALGFPVAAFVRIRPGPGQLRRIVELAERTPEVVECHRITGEDCYFAKAHVRDVEHLEEVIDRFVLFGLTTTSIVQSSPVPVRGIALDA